MHPISKTEPNVHYHDPRTMHPIEQSLTAANAIERDRLDMATKLGDARRQIAELEADNRHLAALLAIKTDAYDSACAQFAELVEKLKSGVTVRGPL